jgi:5'-methylthioadenosine phosphorylase
MAANAARARQALRELAARLPRERAASPIDTALDKAFATAPAARDRAVMARLDAVAGRVLGGFDQ